jgi:hypothetical protein
MFNVPCPQIIAANYPQLISGACHITCCRASNRVAEGSELCAEPDRGQQQRLF